MSSVELLWLAQRALAPAPSASVGPLGRLGLLFMQPAPQVPRCRPVAGGCQAAGTGPALGVFVCGWVLVEGCGACGALGSASWEGWEG